MLKILCITLISFYQRYISIFFGQTCRYYPSCSEYAKQLFSFDHPFYAALKSIKRIACCHQFCQGGIDYPYLCQELKITHTNPIQIRHWLIPKPPMKSLPLFSPSQFVCFFIITIYKGYPCSTK